MTELDQHADAKPKKKRSGIAKWPEDERPRERLLSRGPQDWQRWKQQTEQLHGQIGDLDKNGVFIADMLALAWTEGKPSPTLTRLCQALVEFARQAVT